MARISFELLDCARHGHFLVGADAAELRPQDAVFARDSQAGAPVRWLRCLRCDSWLPAPRPPHPTRRHPPEREEIELPLRGRALRDRYVLRLIAIDRLVHFVILGIVSAAIFVFIRHQTELRAGFYRVLSDLQGGLRGPPTGRHGLVHDINSLVSLQSGKLQTVGLIALAYALLEGLEAVGLWLGKRWAEYLTFIATTLLLPLEVEELVNGASVLKGLTFAVNVAVVLYLIHTKRLFGYRGGGRAAEQERARELGWEALESRTPEAWAVPTGAPGAPAVPAPAAPA